MNSTELLLFFEAWRFMLGFSIRQRAGSLPEEFLGDSLSGSRSRDQQTIETIKACHLAVIRAERYHFVRGNCLLRSTTLVDLLTRRDVSAVVRIGVAKQNTGARNARRAGWGAHAWVETCGLTLGREAVTVSSRNVDDTSTDYQTLGRDCHTG